MKPPKRTVENQVNYEKLTGDHLVVLDASTFQKPIEELAVTIINLVEREGAKTFPQLPRYVHVDFAMILRYLKTLYNFTFFLNADERRETDPYYRQGYSFASLPLIRSMIDGLYNVAAIIDDPSLAKRFRASGYRFSVEALASDAQRYGTDRRFIDEFERKRGLISLQARRDCISEQEIKTATWPTFSKYLNANPKETRLKLFLRSFTYGVWREYSAISHGSLEGLMDISLYIASDNVPHEHRENVRFMGERVMTTHLARVATILLCLLSELAAFYGFKDANISNRILDAWQALTVMPEPRELFETRYKKLLSDVGFKKSDYIPEEFRHYFSS